MKSALRLRRQRGFGLLEVLIAASVLAVGLVVVGQSFSFLYKSEKKLEDGGELEDVRNFFRRALDCRVTIGKNTAGCAAASFAPVPYNRRNEPLTPGGVALDGTPLGRKYKVRLLCGSTVGADTLDVQYAERSATTYSSLFASDTPLRCPQRQIITSPPAAWYCDGRACCYPPPGAIAGTHAGGTGAAIFPDIAEGEPLATPYADCYTGPGKPAPFTVFNARDRTIYGPCQWMSATDPATGITVTWCYQPPIGYLDEHLCVGAPAGEPYTTDWFTWTKPLGGEFDPAHPNGYTLAVGGGHLHHCSGVGLRIRIRGSEHPSTYAQLVCRGANCATGPTTRASPSDTFILTFAPREEFEVRPEDLAPLLDDYGEKRDSGYTIEVAWNYNVELGGNPNAVSPTGSVSCTNQGIYGMGRRAGFGAGVTFVAKGEAIPPSTCSPSLGIP